MELSYKLICTVLFVLLLASWGYIAFIYMRYNELKNKPVVTADNTQCPKGLVCKDFKWVDDYVGVISGDIEWTDCGEGVNKCARWEDYSGKNPLPQVEIKQCAQEGTRLEDGKWVTGLPEGTHILVGTTIRPCEDLEDLDATPSSKKSK